MVHTRNYETLEAITTTKESFNLANVIAEPSTIISQCKTLFEIFFELYLTSEEEQRNLIYDIEHRPRHVNDLLMSIFDQLATADEMLREAQDYEPVQRFPQDDRHTTL